MKLTGEGSLDLKKILGYVLESLMMLAKCIAIAVYPFIFVLVYFSVEWIPFWLFVVSLILLPVLFASFWQNIGHKIITRSNTMGLFWYSVIILVLFSGTYQYQDVHEVVHSYADVVEIAQADDISIYGVGAYTFNVQKGQQPSERIEELRLRTGFEQIRIVKGQWWIKSIESKMKSALEKYYGQTILQQSISTTSELYNLDNIPPYLSDFFNLENVNGPSAGLPLAIQVGVKQNGLNVDRMIVATGKIDAHGNVYKVGLVKHKIIGAAEAGAEFFFCPVGNEKEASDSKRQHNLDILVVPVSTVDDAMNYIKNNISD